MRKWLRVLLWSALAVGGTVFIVRAFGESALLLTFLGFIAGGLAGRHEAEQTGERRMIRRLEELGCLNLDSGDIPAWQRKDFDKLLYD